MKKYLHLNKKILHTGTLFFCVLLCLQGSVVSALMTQDDLNAINTEPGTDVRYDTNDTCDSTSTVSFDTGGSSSTTTGSHGSGTWNSGLQPPYILEQFMIQLLENIAIKRGVPSTDTVTQAHVEALVTFAYGEGGGITNNDFWNPFNSGYGDPALLATAHAVDGKQAFRSFDDGVEAIARAMAGWKDPNYPSHFQTRLGDILTKPDSNVAQFFHALTYYKETPGNLEWATASLSDPANYFNKYMTLDAQKSADWSRSAGLIMRGKVSDPKFKTDVAKLTYHIGPDNTGSSDISNSSTDTTTACCDTSGSTTTAAPGTNNVIVLDPGHIGATNQVTDKTGLIDYDYPNHPEIDDVWDVAQLVSKQLTTDGYSVKMTKDNVDGTKSGGGYVTFRERAQLAIDNHAALAVSIHDDNGFTFSDSNSALVFAQAAGQYRMTNKTSSAKKIPIEAGSVAIAASQDAAAKFVTDRTAAEGHTVQPVKTDATSYIGNRLPSPGSIWMVQLFSTVPWVYNEVGGHTSGQKSLSSGDKQKYADGLIKSIEDAVPIKKASTTTTTTTTGDTSASATPVTSAVGGPASGTDCASPVAGVSGLAAKIAAQAKYLAWPNTRNSAGRKYGPQRTEAKKVYQDAEIKFDGFTSDSSDILPFSDCGVFVSTVMRSSGVDPKYPRRGTPGQRPYLESHTSLYERVLQDGHDPTDTSKLKSGDILITSSGEGHTYLYLDNWGDKDSKGNFQFNSASGSWKDHVPQAGNFYQHAAGAGQHFEVFRIIDKSVSV